MTRRVDLRIAVVGSGITGLATHHFLEKEARHLGLNVEVETWDPNERPGGNIRTTRRDGFLCESAAESILNSKRETRDLALSLGLYDRIVQASSQANKRFVLHHDQIRALKPGPGALFGSFPTWPAKFRALVEPFQSKGPEDESVADFVRRRLGSGIFEELADAAVTGIYAASPERLSVRSAFPALKEMEQVHGSLFGALLRRSGNSRKKTLEGDARFPRKGSWSLRGGLAELVDALRNSLKGPCYQDRSLDELVRRGEGWILRSGQHEIRVDRVVMALPAHAAAGIPGDLPDWVREELGGIPYNPVSVVGLGYKRKDVAHPLDGFGFLVPRGEKRRILGTLFSSSLWPHAAPSGHVLLRTMVGGGRQPELCELSETDVARLVQEELADLLGVQGEPIFRQVSIWPHGIPEYPVGHSFRLRRLRAMLEGTSLFLAGNAFDGIGINDCVAAALPRARLVLGKPLPPPDLGMYA